VKPASLLLAVPLALLVLASGCASTRAPADAVDMDSSQPTPASITTLAPVATSKADTARELARFSPSTVLDRVRIRETREMLPRRAMDYQVGSDDVLEVSIFEWELTEVTRTLEVRVSKSGLIALPVVGAIQVGGQSVEDIQKRIGEELSRQNIIATPRVAVTVKQYRSRQVSAVGAVIAPGVYSLQENVSTLTDFLALAGGPSEAAAPVAQVLIPPTPPETEPVRITVDLDELFKTGRPELDPLLKGGETVYVPPAPFIYVYGNVLQPGSIPLRRPLTFLEAIALAGGFDNKADTAQVRLNRKTRGVREESLYVNVDKIERGDAADPYLHEGDIIIVSSAPSKNLAHGMWEVFRSIFSVSYRLNAND
jgi:polysaccharide export outer membrane protein